MQPSSVKQAKNYANLKVFVLKLFLYYIFYKLSSLFTKLLQLEILTIKLLSFQFLITKTSKLPPKLPSSFNSSTFPFLISTPLHGARTFLLLILLF